MKKLLLLSLALTTLFASCVPSTDNEKSSAAKVQPLPGTPRAWTKEEIAERQKMFEAEEAEKESARGWRYAEDKDRMSGKISIFASLDADGLIKFDFPYDGGSQFTLILRRKEKGKSEVLLKCDKCQFMNGYGDTKVLKVKFDDGRPETYSFNSAADGSSDLIFINSPGKFINKLRSSKSILIEADFFQNGSKYIDFTNRDLQWD